MNKHVPGLAAAAALALAMFPQASQASVALECGQNYCTAASTLPHDYISWNVDDQGTGAIIPQICDGTDVCVFRCPSPGYVGVGVTFWNAGQPVGTASSQALCSEV